MKIRQNKGFTLLEILIFVVGIGILGAIIFFGIKFWNGNNRDIESSEIEEKKSSTLEDELGDLLPNGKEFSPINIDCSNNLIKPYCEDYYITKDIPNNQVFVAIDEAYGSEDRLFLDGDKVTRCITNGNMNSSGVMKGFALEDNYFQYENVQEGIKVRKLVAYDKSGIIKEPKLLFISYIAESVVQVSVYSLDKTISVQEVEKCKL